MPRCRASRPSLDLNSLREVRVAAVQRPGHTLRGKVGKSRQGATSHLHRASLRQPARRGTRLPAPRTRANSRRVARSLHASTRLSQSAARAAQRARRALRSGSRRGSKRAGARVASAPAASPARGAGSSRASAQRRTSQVGAPPRARSHRRTPRSRPRRRRRRRPAPGSLAARPVGSGRRSRRGAGPPPRRPRRAGGIRGPRPRPPLLVFSQCATPTCVLAVVWLLYGRTRRPPLGARAWPRWRRTR
mmetsp:Transcript_24026/g.60785  ORF Transcript_24026/g.60785 Transcript_24026/m.60785 type:complete len:247 (+) Transcript_24026:196-936(+)